MSAYKNIIILLLIIMISVQLIGCSNENSDEFINIWTNDINFVKDIVNAKYDKSIHIENIGDFNKSIDNLLKNLEHMNENEILISLYKNIAIIGDSNIFINSYQLTDGYLGVHIDKIDSQFFIINTTLSNKDYLYTQVLEINGVPINEVYNKILSLLPDDNAYWKNIRAITYLSYSNIFEALNLVKDEKIIFTIFDGKHEEKVWIRKANAYNTTFIVHNPINEYHHVASNYLNKLPFYEIEKIEDLMILKWNKSVDITELKDNDREIITETYLDENVQKLVIDFRGNLTGVLGSETFLVNLIKIRPDIMDYNNIFVAIGNRTYSAGVLIAERVASLTNATLIGEPSGSTPDYLPVINYEEFPNNKRNYILYVASYGKGFDQSKIVNSLVPDISIKYTIDDYKNGTDPVYEYILNGEY